MRPALVVAASLVATACDSRPPAPAPSPAPSPALAPSAAVCTVLAGARLDAIDPGPAICSYGPIGPVACDRYVTFSASPKGLAFRLVEDEPARSRESVGECACTAEALECRVTSDAAPGDRVDTRWDAARGVLTVRGVGYAVRRR